MNEKQQVLNLTNICDGKLEAEFEEMYKDALRKISKGQKAKITINIEMLRVPDTDTIVELGYNIKSTLPAISRRAIGSYADDFTVKVDVNEKLLIAVRNFKYVTQTEGDFTRTDDDNYVMSIKVKEAEGTLKMPRFIFVNMVILNESQFTQKIEVQLDIIKPKDEGDKLSFKLSCPIMNRYIKDAIKSETDSIKSELTNYLLLSGTQE